jgi:hypothetical protein
MKKGEMGDRRWEMGGAPALAPAPAPAHKHSRKGLIIKAAIFGVFKDSMREKKFVEV